MKNLLYIAVSLAMLATACQKVDLQDYQEENMVWNGDRKCDADVVLQQQLAADPQLRNKLHDIEAFTQRYAALQQKGLIQQARTSITIPVVVNVLYRTAAENISDAQIQSQIDVLNKDFTASNADLRTGYIPPEYAQLPADIEVTFALQSVVRKQTNKRSWTTNDGMKKSKQGGIDATTPTEALNIWVCTLSNNILGYAQFPGGNPETDGVVILNTAFGNTGTATAPYGLGRTATHEIGHWMNLRHIWGDMTCGTDYVDDTPLHNTANYRCPAPGHLSTCTGTPKEMWMNYMDYTYDECMYMFTEGQKTRMQAVFAVGGPRASFAD